MTPAKHFAGAIFLCCYFLTPTSHLVGVNNFEYYIILHFLVLTSRLVSTNYNSLHKYFFIQGPEIIKTNKEKHEHPPGEELEKRKDQQKLTELAEANVLSARSAITELTKGKNEEEMADLPKVASMKRKILRHRENINDPKNPEKKTGFVIPPEFEKYCEEHFLRVDTGADDPDRILIFVTDQGLMDLKRYRNWSSDGTFRSAPKIFYQIFMVHVHINETQCAPRYVYCIFLNVYLFIMYEPVIWFILEICHP